MDQREWCDLAAIIAVMHAKGVTPPQLAKEIDVTPRTLARILAGETQIKLTQLRRIRKVLGVPWSELLPEDAA